MLFTLGLIYNYVSNLGFIKIKITWFIFVYL
jgi:hypothetical protein